MTTIRVTFEDSGVQNALNQQANRLGNPREMLADIGAHMDMKTRTRIRQLGQPQDAVTTLDGQAWAPLAEATIKHKQRKRKKERKLQQDGELLGTITYQANSQQVEIGSGAKHSVYQQFGTKNIPARPFLFVTAEDEAEIGEIVRDFLS
ncbi:phage virion morphogenesis protein [Synechococcus sp. PCC 6312]|uniref:phage virion morphogenesis protein n=1 Tax=Synechococcus sp. (strain ATCC 27167 / PCC 6312) TaxID=195253 RepID=UPI00029F22F9|nr:phage virion morphogenesis protein [Synechococcus sp. PCC 6312]AFY60349.1 Mu-like prophage protein gpG [Synechococcus sp. PCC 6312]